jgi:hypothetical protein
LKSSAENLEILARAGKFRNFCGFPATFLNFPLKIRISSDSGEMPPTSRGKSLKIAFFSSTLAERNAAEKILRKFDISSDSFALAADKNQIALTMSKFVNEIGFAAGKSLVQASIWISGRRFGRLAMESPKRPEKRNS